MSARKPRKQVYVSSTFSDLEQHRAHLKLALEKAGYDVECMERYPAFDERPADKCLADVAACDIYVVLVALRYGYVPADDNPDSKSITEMEYDKAVEAGRSKLAFMLDIDDDFGWPLKRCDKNCQDADSKIARFRERVGTELGRALFTTPESLSTAVLQALRQQEIAGMPAGERDHAQIRETYLDWLRRECDSVELLGLELRESRNVGLAHVYVPAVTNARLKDERNGFTLGEGSSLLVYKLGFSPLYMPGAAGSGKSTFCRWLAKIVAEGRVPPHRQIAVDCRDFTETLPDSLVGRLPLLVRLRDWASHGEFLSGRGRWTRAQLEASLAGWLDKTRPGDFTAEVFHAELKVGRCLLILDGVDEVPESRGDDLPRRNLLSGLADALPAWRKAGNWLLLTSRPYGLELEDQRRLDLPVAELAELPRELQTLFVRRWFDAVDPPRGAEKADELLGHLAQRDDLAEMRSNPMLLTALCVKYDEGRRLPQDSHELYDAVVRQVLYKRCNTEIEREQARNRLGAVALGMHRGEVGAPRQNPAAEVAVDEVDRLLANLARHNWASESGSMEACAKRELLLSDSGLLLPRSNHRTAFYHLSFQEFLAAERLQKLREDPTDILKQYSGTPAWRRTLTFLFCAIAARESPERALAAWKVLLPSFDAEAVYQNPAPARVLADCLEVAYAKGWCIDDFNEGLLSAYDHAFPAFSPALRVQLWLNLGWLDLDNRFGVGLRVDGVPDIAWRICEAGDFLYGDAKESRTLKTPFRIALYPITHRQFQAFVDAGGYGEDEWWAGLPERPGAIPAAWSEPNVPREMVSWYEATAFCRWLDVQLRKAGSLPDKWRVTLPTEEQWERAARGADGREYPWKGGARSGLANINETWGRVGACNLGRTSPVGLYPEGKAPSGALDMAGNVLEWCSDEYEQPERGVVDATDRPRVVRGGSFVFSSSSCRAAYRYWFNPDGRSHYLGFRVCCSPIS